MEPIPDQFRDLFEGKTFAHFATIPSDGMAHVTPVWVDYDGEHVLVNTAMGRRKVQNIQTNPNVGLSILDPDDPYRYVSVRGKVEEITEDGADKHIDELAKRYMGVDEYPNRGDEQGPRVIVKIRPEEVLTGG